MREAMNPLNYASLEASKKLVDNGIWLETDYFYVNTFSNMGWVFRQKGGFNDEDDFIPAPSMAEVWRELPEETVCKKQYSAWLFNADNFFKAFVEWRKTK